MRQRLIALVVVVAFLVGLGAVIKYGTTDSAMSPADAGNLSKLPDGGSAERSASGTGTPPWADAISTMYAPDYQMTYTVEGELPRLDGTAAAYTFDGRASEGDFATLAKAIGVTGTADAKGDFIIVSGKTENLALARTGAQAWSFYLAISTAGDDCSTSSDGTTECRGSGSSGAVASCAVPACPPDAKCPEPAAGCEPAPALSRPADLPSKDEAERAARTFLARIGTRINNSVVTVTDQFSSWAVRFVPTIDGHGVEALATHVRVGPKGVIQSAAGHLGTPVKIGDYPLAGTAAGIQRLRDGKFIGLGGFGGYAYATDLGAPPMEGGVEGGPATRSPATTVVGGAGAPASASGSSGGGNPGIGGTMKAPAPPPTVVAKPGQPMPAPMPYPGPAPAPIVVTGVRIDLALVAGGDGSAKLVPAYTFLSGNGWLVGSVPAVIDALIQPSPTPPAPYPMPLGGAESQPGVEPMPVPDKPNQPATTKPATP